MYQIFFTNQAEKNLKNLDKIYQPKIKNTVDLLSHNPFLGQKMAGVFKNSYRIKIPPLRIIYTLDIKRKIIWIKAIGQRGGIYNR